MSHDDHHGPAYLQHHFETPRQQFGAGKFGMWLFLAQEVLFFSGLFCAYAVYRFNHPEVFDYAHHFLSWELGALNTVVLLVSSLTMALGVRAAQLSDNRQLLVMLALTFLCASAFMVVKYIEYSEKFSHGLFPGQNLDYAYLSQEEQRQGKEPLRAKLKLAEKGQPTAIPDLPPPDIKKEADRTLIPLAHAEVGAGLVRLHSEEAGHGEVDHDAGHHFELPPGVRPRNIHQFFSIYFCLTGLHGIHVLAGMIMLAWLFVGALKGRFNSEYFTPVDLGGLYWHLVDLIWIFLFPLLYLIS